MWFFELALYKLACNNNYYWERVAHASMFQEVSRQIRNRADNFSRGSTRLSIIHCYHINSQHTSWLPLLILFIITPHSISFNIKRWIIIISIKIVVVCIGCQYSCYRLYVASISVRIIIIVTVHILEYTLYSILHFPTIIIIDVVLFAFRKSDENSSHNEDEDTCFLD